MNTVMKWWAPSGADLSAGERKFLAVRNPQRPLNTMYLTLLAQKLQELIDADQRRARVAMEMSVEHAPVLWSIAHSEDESNWGVALVNSDLLMPLLAKINWNRRGRLIGPDHRTLQEMLEML